MNETSLAYLLPMKKAIKDEPSQMWSFIDIFWFITIPKDLEFVINDFYIAAKINNVVAGPAKVEIQIINPDDTINSSALLTGSFNRGDADVVASFTSVKLETGKYKLRMVYNDNTLIDNGKYYFEVKK